MHARTLVQRSVSDDTPRKRRGMAFRKRIFIARFSARHRPSRARLFHRISMGNGHSNGSPDSRVKPLLRLTADQNHSSLRVSIDI